MHPSCNTPSGSQPPLAFDHGPIRIRRYTQPIHAEYNIDRYIHTCIAMQSYIACKCVYSIPASILQCPHSCYSHDALIHPPTWLVRACLSTCYSPESVPNSMLAWTLRLSPPYGVLSVDCRWVLSCCAIRSDIRQIDEL